MDLSVYDAEVENYGQFLDLQKPKRIDKFKLLCHCPKCGKLHIRTYRDLKSSKEFIYCRAHKSARAYEAKYGPGITCAALIPEVQEKIAATKAARYGDNWGQTWYEQQKKRVSEIMGVENPGLAPDHALKSFNSMVERYGSTEKAYAIRQKHIEETAENEYGSYETYTKIRLGNQIDSLKDKYNDNSITSINNIPPLKEKRFDEYLNAIQYFDKVSIIFKGGDYNFRCAVCGYEVPVSYENRLYRCPECTRAVKPKGQITSINAFINKQGVQSEMFYKDAFSGFVFDIYIPSKNIGIDLISTATHSNIGNYDLQNKALDCEKFGITFICLMEDYWYTKPEIVQAKIKDVLGIHDKELNGLYGAIREIEPEQYDYFCEENHLWGKGLASLKLGMYINDELVAVAGLAVPRYIKSYDWEIIRFCCKKGYFIENALRAFVIWMVRMHENESIIYYHDMRWPDDTNNALEFLRNTVPSVYYWKGDGKLESWSLNKRTWIEHKDNFDFNGELSTRLNLLKEGYNIMYDCGYKVYIYE